MLIQCPHCYKDILPRDDESCPACQQDTGDAEALANPFRPVEFPLYPVGGFFCALCGAPADTTKRVVEKMKDTDALVRNAGTSIFGTLFGGLFGFGVVGTEKVSYEVSVDVPLCDHCERCGAVSVHNVSYERQTISVMCHREFRDRISTDG